MKKRRFQIIYTVGEMAQKLGVPASTLRYYDKEGLLPFVERSSGGIRMFRENDFEWLHGIPGNNHLNAHAHLKELVKEKTEEGVLIGAICAGPMVLGGLGLLKGKRATCFPFFEPTMVGATPTDNGVEQDGNIITSKGPGFMFEFGLTILRNLKDEEIALEVADALLYDALLHGTKH